MRSGHILESNHEVGESKRINIRHLRVIDILNAAKNLVEDDLAPPPPHYFRQNRVPLIPLSPTVYMIKESGALIIDKGEYDDSLKQNPAVVNLGKNPIPCIPEMAHRAFQAELSEAVELSAVSQTFFFRRPMIASIITDSTPVSKDLARIVMSYL